MEKEWKHDIYSLDLYEKYDEIFKHINDLIAILNEDLKVEYINEKIHNKELLYSKEDLIGNSPLKFIHPDDIDKSIYLFRKAVKVGNAKGKIRFKTKLGNYIWLESNGCCYYDNRGKMKFIIISRDITEQKIKEEIKSSIVSIVENSIDAIIGKKLDGTIIYWNLGAEKIFGYKQEEIIGKSIDILYPEKTKLDLNQIRAKIVNGLNVNCIETVMLKKGKEQIDVSLTFSSIKDEYGSVIGISLIARDITRKKIMEKQLKESENKLKNINKILKVQVMERTKNLMISLKKIRDAYNRIEFYEDLFTHDMRNIFQNLIMGIELIRQDLKNKKHMEHFEEIYILIKNQISKGSRLISNILNLSKLENSRLKLKKIALIPTLEKSIQSLRENFPQKSIKLSMNTLNDKLYIKGNELIKDVFENLLINAVVHNQNQIIEIIIKISKVQYKNIKMIRLEFIDNGIGIEPYRKKVIFKRGYQNEKIKRRIGLGLTFVGRVIEKYGGKIFVEDKIRHDYKKGSKFVLLIPEVN